LDSILTEFNTKWNEAIKSYREYKLKNFNTFEFKFDDHGYLQEILQAINIEHDSSIIDHYKLIYIAFASYSTKEYDINRAKEYFESVKPSNAAWGDVIQAFFSYHRLFKSDKIKTIQNDFLLNSKVRDIKFTIIVDKLANLKFSNQNDTNEYVRLYTLLKNEYSDVPYVESWLRLFGKKSKIIVGTEIPDFSFTSIDDSTRIFSKKKLMGKHYLLDFWATWCKPCIKEIRFIEQIFQKYSQEDLTIISVSIDSKIAAVNKFRKENNKMKWGNVFLRKEEKAKVISDFEVVGVPKPILVGPQGKILAMDFELRGTKLEKTLEKFIK
jgi:thiol-disulfide isomerase/thioredoxin